MEREKWRVGREVMKSEGEWVECGEVSGERGNGEWEER